MSEPVARTEEDGFLDAISASKGRDTTTMLVYADWLEDNGERVDLAEAFRWMAKRDRWPLFWDRYVGVGGVPTHKVPEQYSWAWVSRGFYFAFAEKQRWGQENIDRAYPKPVVMAAMFGGETFGHNHKYYPSWQAAVAGLAASLKLLREEIAS